jgi:hypothetical protein
MGYTHYWDNPGFTEDQWDVVRDHTKKILAASTIKVQYEDDDKRPPVRSTELIRFNGVEDKGHETFYLERVPRRTFGFCKTARKPYDEIVVAMLTMLVSVVPEFSWSSDGEFPEFAEGLALWDKVK